ncbi:MAG TPA: SDR family oxidoreductase, partial [Usitatibacter sp.]|nr:SDR family oxidoreductase [Usitatibacter sp.]
MPILAGKKILVTGLLSNRSIAFGIAKAARREGASIALTYQNDRFKDRAEEMGRELGADLALPCDVTNDSEIDALFQQLKDRWNGLDGLVHALAFAPREAIAGDFLDG